MSKLALSWRLSHTPDLALAPQEEIPATVPGAVQLDYAAAKGYPPYTFGTNFRLFRWMEDEYFFYTTQLDFTCAPGETALLRLNGVDYRYILRLDGTEVKRGEGAFTPVTVDVTRFSGQKTKLEVILCPIPKLPGKPDDRQQAAACCKPASSYEWDWHPRLVPTGLWEDAYVELLPAGSPKDLEVSYRLTDDLSSVTVNAEAEIIGAGPVTVTLTAPDGTAVCTETRESQGGLEAFTLTLDKPLLWFPRGYGDQPIYTLTVKGGTERSRKLGFRRSKLLRNADDVERFEADFPKQPLPAPATLEINGQRVFARGSNWVNAEIFPCLLTDKRYDELLGMAYDANMNILRLWGGQYINREYFYDKCDELGIMVWQEFMLSCNLHPDDDDYLAVLKQEATTIIRRLRSHPCLAFWAGGNELFNSWSGLTCQSHPLRLLDSICFELDRFTPFNMASPMHGMAHGTYVKATVTEGTADPTVDDVKAQEFIEVLKGCDYNTYTEFGCNGGATPEYLKKYIMTEEDYQNCSPDNEVWVAHHAFKAWNGDLNWLGREEVKFYFGGWDSMDDLMEKTLWLQAMAYKSHFEEMRRKWPHCSMAVNWDYNEPWPCAAGNSLVNWPAEPKPALKAVGEALRPTLISAESAHNRYLAGETYEARVWVINDSLKATPATKVEATLEYGETKVALGTVSVDAVEPGKNAAFGSVSFPVTADMPRRFRVAFRSAAHPELDSVYDYVKK